jgi:hypothetical protein
MTMLHTDAAVDVFKAQESHISSGILEVKYEYFKHYFINYGNF